MKYLSLCMIGIVLVILFLIWNEKREKVSLSSHLRKHQSTVQQHYYLYEILPNEIDDHLRKGDSMVILLDRLKNGILIDTDIEYGTQMYHIHSIEENKLQKAPLYSNSNLVLVINKLSELAGSTFQTIPDNQIKVSFINKFSS